LFLKDKLPYRLDFVPTIKEIIEELIRGREPGTIALKFHNTLARPFWKSVYKPGKKKAWIKLY